MGIPRSEGEIAEHKHAVDTVDALRTRETLEAQMRSHAGEARYHADEAFFSPMGSPEHRYHMEQAEFHAGKAREMAKTPFLPPYQPMESQDLERRPKGGSGPSKYGPIPAFAGVGKNREVPSHLSALSPTGEFPDMPASPMGGGIVDDGRFGFADSNGDGVLDRSEFGGLMLTQSELDPGRISPMPSDEAEAHRRDLSILRKGASLSPGFYGTQLSNLMDQATRYIEEEVDNDPEQPLGLGNIPYIANTGNDIISINDSRDTIHVVTPSALHHEDVMSGFSARERVMNLSLNDPIANSLPPIDEAGFGISDISAKAEKASTKKLVLLLNADFQRVQSSLSAKERAQILGVCVETCGDLRVKLEYSYSMQSQVVETSSRLILLFKDLKRWDEVAVEQEKKYTQVAFGRSELVTEEMRQAALDVRLAANLALEEATPEADGIANGADVVNQLVRKDLAWLVDQLKRV